MIITLSCPEHGDWHPDLASPRSRSTCPVPGCTFRGVPTAGMFRTARGEGIDLDAAIAPLPATHQAMIRLMMCAVIDRHHQPGDGHASGLAAGATGTGKTLIAHVICAAFGLDPVTHVLEVAKQTELSLWGRRTQEPGGRYSLTPADALDYPFLALDELDKADGALRAAALRLLQGNARIPAEGQLVHVAPAVYATSNGALADVPGSYRRRAVCLDTSRMDPVSYATARQVLTAVPRLPLPHLRPPAAGLPPAALGSLTRGLEAALTPEGMRLCDVRGLERLTAARAALNGGSIGHAVAGTLEDYLRCAATTGATVPRWQDRMIAAATGRTQVAPARPGAELVTGPPAPAVALMERLAAIGAAATWKARLTRALADLDEAATLPGVPADYADQADGLLAMGEELIELLADARSASALGMLQPVAEQFRDLANEAAGLMRASAGVLAANQRRELETRPAAGPEPWVIELRDRQLRAAAAPRALPAGRPAPEPLAGGLAASPYIGMWRKDKRRTRKAEAAPSAQARSDWGLARWGMAGPGGVGR